MDGCVPAAVRGMQPLGRARSLRSYGFRAGRAGGWGGVGTIRSDRFWGETTRRTGTTTSGSSQATPVKHPSPVSRAQGLAPCAPDTLGAATNLALVNTVVHVCSKRGRYRPSDCHCRTSVVRPQFCGARTTLLLARIVLRQLAP